MEPNAYFDYDISQNTSGTEQPLHKDEGDTNDSVSKSEISEVIPNFDQDTQQLLLEDKADTNELNKDSDSDSNSASEISEPNSNYDRDTSQNTSETEQPLLEQQGDSVANELNSKSESVQDECKPILQESTESKTNIIATSLCTLSHEKVTEDKLVTLSAPLDLQQRPKFDDLPIATSFLSVRHKKGLRKIMSNKDLSQETKIAQKNERKREMLIKSKQEMMEELNTDGKSLALDYDSKTKEYLTVHPKIVEQLKEHQVDGVKFMYDCCFVGVDHIETFPGSGCILAHCMGLGKTLQVGFF